MEDSYKHDTKWKKPVTKEHVLYNYIYMEIKGGQN